MGKTLYKTFLFAFIACSSVTILNSCVEHNLAQCHSSEIVSFSTQIQPIITANCAIEGDGGCHNGGNGPDLDWRKLSNFQNHKSEAERRVTLPKGDPDHMPRIGELKDDEIQLLVCWVEQGGLDN